MSHLDSFLSTSNGVKRSTPDTDTQEADGHVDKKPRKDTDALPALNDVDNDRDEDFDQDQFANLEAAAALEGLNVEDLLALVENSHQVQEMDDAEVRIW